MEIKIRDVDPVAIAKIDELARKKGMSRNSYLKQCISQFALLQDTINLDSKYQALVNSITDRLEQANDIIERNTEIIKNFLDK